MRGQERDQREKKKGGVRRGVQRMSRVDEESTGEEEGPEKLSFKKLEAPCQSKQLDM